LSPDKFPTLHSNSDPNSVAGLITVFLHYNCIGPRRNWRAGKNPDRLAWTKQELLVPTRRLFANHLKFRPSLCVNGSNGVPVHH
jgi:hypothetical protein